MVELEEFSIVLEPCQLVYYPGEKITGIVIIDLKEEMEMKCLKVKFIGIACCQWKERQLKYSGKEKIIEKEACLFGNMNPTPLKFSHPAGKYSYKFSFSLPSDLPSSFEDTPGDNVSASNEEFGFIRYMLKAKINKPWKDDFKLKYPVVINDYIDTNLTQYRYGPDTELREKKSGWCGCFGKESEQSDIEFSASIDRACYCPGEPILINAHVKNKTSNYFHSMSAEIRQQIRYRASGKTKTFESKIDDLKGPKILKGTSFSWQNLPFFIPPSSPTILNSKILSVKYELRFSVILSSGKGRELELPLIIGTVPRRTQYGKFIHHYKTIPSGTYINNIKFPVPVPSIFAVADNVTASCDETPREVVSGYCKSVRSMEVDISEDDDTNTWGTLSYTPLFTFVKISREIPIEVDPPKICDPKHLVNVTVQS